MKHMEEMKIAGLAMALCIVMLGIYIVVPKDGTTSHLTAIPDNNAAQPATDSTSQGQGSADTGNDDYFPIYTEDSYDSEADNSYSDGSGDNGDSDTLMIIQVIRLITAITIQIHPIMVTMEMMK